MKIRTISLALVALLGLVAIGCEEETPTTTTSSGSSSSSGAGGNGGTGGGGGSGGGGMTMPALGKQVDRMGRPAINTAANETFNPNDAQANTNKDAYNAAMPDKWADYAGEIQANLGILDSLDTVCGNQLLADMNKNDPTRYSQLATVLADDRLYVNMVGPMCTTYLGVEANAVGVMNNDCGGRTLAYDVIDVSYTVLATGALDASVGDDVPISAAAQGTTFPYLATPH